MDHVAIMRKSWGLIPRILDGRKIIESRWSKNKCPPWGKVKKGDRVFFKNSGEPICLKAKVKKIIEFENLNPDLVKQIFNKYGKEDGITKKELKNYISWAKNKKYCTLIYLSDIKKIKPFYVDKKGFGMGAAWLSMSNINLVKIKY